MYITHELEELYGDRYTWMCNACIWTKPRALRGLYYDSEVKWTKKFGKRRATAHIVEKYR